MRGASRREHHRISVVVNSQEPPPQTKAPANRTKPRLSCPQSDTFTEKICAAPAGCRCPSQIALPISTLWPFRCQRQPMGSPRAPRRRDCEPLPQREDACRVAAAGLSSRWSLATFGSVTIRLHANGLASDFGAQVITATGMSHQIPANLLPFARFVRFHDGGCGRLAIRVASPKAVKTGAQRAIPKPESVTQIT